MKTTNPIGIGILIALIAVTSYWLGYQDGNTATGRSLHAVSSLQQKSLCYREGRNSVPDLGAMSNAVDGVIQDKSTWIDGPSL